MPKLRNSMLILLMLLTGCTTAPRVLVQAICPRIPELDQPPAAQVPAFTNRMQSFLQGNLPAPTSYSLTSGSARLPTPTLAPLSGQ